MNENLSTLLASTHRIAIVGLSDKPWRTSYQIAQSLIHRGYTVLPVNPKLKEWNGLPAYPNLSHVPAPIDLVNVFRRSEYVSDIVDEAIAAGAAAIWTQLDVVDWEAAERAERGGLHVVMDRCISVELMHMR